MSVMSEAVEDELSVLSSIYCGHGEFELLQRSAQDGVLVQIRSPVGAGWTLLFHLSPNYPSCPPDVSVSSTRLSRSQCLRIRHKILEHAATLPPHPMMHQLVQWTQQCEEVRQDEETAGDGRDREDRLDSWTSVLWLDHIRSRSRYLGLLQCWTQQLQLSGTVLLGPGVLVVLQGARAAIKEFCRLLKTVKVDVDSSGRKCKERMMKVLVEAPSLGSCGHSLQSFVAKDYTSSADLSEAFRELNMSELYEQIRPSLRV